MQEHPQYLFLNDATSEDAAAEYAIVKGRRGAASHVQIESVTFSWCDEGRALQYVREALAGAYDQAEFVAPVTCRLETPEQHGRCHHCA